MTASKSPSSIFSILAAIDSSLAAAAPPCLRNILRSCRPTAFSYSLGTVPNWDM